LFENSKRMRKRFLVEGGERDKSKRGKSISMILSSSPSLTAPLISYLKTTEEDEIIQE